MKVVRIYFLLLLLCCTSNFVYAGLVVKLDEGLSFSRIENLTIQDGNLIVRYNKNIHTINLPNNALAAIIKWVATGAQGPQIFSIDDAIVPGAPDYISPGIPEPLGDEMLSYDSYAHSLAIGGVPRDYEGLHPLIKKNGDDSKMPHKVYNHLMQPTNQSNKAKWYRYMTTQYATRPSAVGELTIIAVSAKEGFPVKLNVESFLTLRPRDRFRSISVVSRRDAWLFSLPYQPLKEDIEARWPAYRQAFTPLDELSSVVEAYAILYTLYHQHPEGWEVFINKNDIGQVQYINSADGPFLSTYRSYWNPRWEREPEDGDLEITTVQEAKVFIDKIWDFEIENNLEELIDKIALIAERDVEIKFRLMLLKIYLNYHAIYGEEELNILLTEYLAFSKKKQEWLGLRIEGLRLLEAEIGLSESIFIDEVKSIVNDFVEIVASYKDAETSLEDWEILSQIVYSTGLLSMIEKTYYYYPVTFVQHLAHVHRNRGLAFQKGRELGYAHAHFRFLGYLADKAYPLTEDLKDQIKLYQSELAELMGITQWNNEQFNSIGLEDNSSHISKKASQGDYVQFEGELESMQKVFDKKGLHRANSTFKNEGIPLILKTQSGQSIKLLMDSKLIISEKLRSQRIRISGIYYEAFQAISPIEIEEYRNEKWIILDIPSAHRIFNLGTSVKKQK